MLILSVDMSWQHDEHADMETVLVSIRVSGALKREAQKRLIDTGSSLQSLLEPVVVDALRAVVSGAQVVELVRGAGHGSGIDTCAEPRNERAGE